MNQWQHGNMEAMAWSLGWTDSGQEDMTVHFLVGVLQLCPLQHLGQVLEKSPMEAAQVPGISTAI